MDLIDHPLMFLTITTIIKFFALVLGFVMPLAAVLTWMERRQSAFMQDRLGPHRAHFFKFRGKPFSLAGLIHVAADGMKMFFKEPFMPASADKMIYQMAPAIGFCSSLMIMSMIPFGPDLHFPEVSTIWSHIPLQMVRIDTGLLVVFALGSLGVYGASLAGFSSNNRFALMGGLRAAAQGISYEIALGLTVVGMLIVTGTTELSSIVGHQSGLAFHGLLPRWGIFLQPMGAILFLTAAIAETKRGPFDLPEGESEIIGYFVEYSSMGFGLFMLGEFVEIVTLSSLFTTLFLGGWQLPWILGDHTLWLGFTTVELGTWGHAAVGVLVFATKVFFMCALQLQIRWTLPRFRYDQLMNLGWKGLLPLALINIFMTAGLVWWDPSLDGLVSFGVVTIILFFLVVIAGPRRVTAHPVPAH